MNTLSVLTEPFRRGLLFFPHICFLLGLLAWLVQAHLRAEAWEGRPAFPESRLGRGACTLLAIAVGMYGLLIIGDPGAGWLGYVMTAVSAVFLLGRGLHFLPPAAFYVPFLVAGFSFLFGR
ncbi:MAG: hypothetical protein WBR18_13470 [Anaerolineales bacterium]